MVKNEVVYTIPYIPSKRIVTLNELKTKWQWYKAQQYYRREFIDLLTTQKVKKFKSFDMVLKFNTGHDVDNMVPVCKFFVDVLRELKYVTNDTKAQYTSLMLKHSNEIPKKSIQFELQTYKK